MAKTCPAGLIARLVRVRTQPLLSDVKIRRADAACSNFDALTAPIEANSEFESAYKKGGFSFAYETH